MIPIRNVFYMLAYAFQTLNQQGYKDIATEDFSNTAELCAAILEKGIVVQLKRGLGKEYIPRVEALSTLRGKVDVANSIKTQSILKKQIVCAYDDFDVDTYFNQIVKSTVGLLIRSDISKGRKKKLRQLMVYFSEVDCIDLHTINWNVKYNSNNQAYRMLISICYLVVKGLLQSKTDGSTRMMDFLDDQRMNRLYEKFILNYYRQEFPQIGTSASQIKWQLDDDVNIFLPIMQTDIMLTYENKTLIIDAKYYSRITQSRYDVNTLHSGNLYQIFTYVKNKSFELKNQINEVSGMLLYAQTDETFQPNNTYLMSGNKVMVRTLDLNCDFCEIKKELNGIVEENFGVTCIQHFA